eukprot:1023610-Rhodomonas_salina.6
MEPRWKNEVTSWLKGDMEHVILRRLVVPAGQQLSATSSHRHPSMLVVECPPTSTLSLAQYSTAATPSPTSTCSCQARDTTIFCTALQNTVYSVLQPSVCAYMLGVNPTTIVSFCPKSNLSCTEMSCATGAAAH